MICVCDGMCVCVQVYLDWANHHIRNYGSTKDYLKDLKEISDGSALPRLLKAIGEHQLE